MNGKQAKLLRKMQRDDAATKREFQKLPANARGKLRAEVTAYMAFQSILENAQTDPEPSAEPEQGESL